MRRAAALGLLGLLAGCARSEPVIETLPQLRTDSGAAPARVNGDVGSTERPLAPQISYGQSPPLAVRGSPPTAGRGDIELDFADTDIRDVVGQILGTYLKANYTIDPAVHGTATLHTATPFSPAQLLPVLQVLLAQAGASLLQSDGLYRIVPTAAAGGAAPAGSDAVAGTGLVPLHFASAEDLARVLQPFIGVGGRIVADPGRNALLITGDAAVRTALLGLVQALDIDLLAGQSYALLPVAPGDAKDFAAALQDAVRAQAGAPLAGVVRVIPMARLNAVLVVSSQPRTIDDVRRIYTVVERSRRDTVRSWHVLYLQNSHANDAAYVLQQAFTPDAVTAQPSGSGAAAPGTASQSAASQSTGGGASAGIGHGGIGTGTGIGGGAGTSAAASGFGSGFSGGGTAGAPSAASAPASGGGNASAATSSANPLLGGLDGAAGGAAPATNEMRIIPNLQNNALLVYATGREEDTVEGMLRKLDILPLQVRIDATIAEVTLNDQLQYGTQFFFKSGGINGVLSNATQSPIASSLVTTALGTSLPGFIIGGTGVAGAPFAISALQAVTTVHVLSSPQLLVLDNQTARLQVGNLVPYLTSSSQSTLVNNSPIINSVNYQPTGVIMQVTPRVNSGGLVTLDISQEVSDVDTTAPTTSGISSPTFLERNVSSRVVVQDGQTVGLAGLIRDSSSRGNQGIPWLKDIPLLGLLAGTQNNLRTRTELLVLITPHVLHEARDARTLTEELREQLINAAAVPGELGQLRTTGSNDPNRPIRRGLRLEQ